MANRRPSSNSPVPSHARDVIAASVEHFPDHPLDIEFRGRNCYVRHAGDPLCRLGYIGVGREWDFAVYRYSTGAYRSLELAPARDTPENCIRTALGVYDLL